MEIANRLNADIATVGAITDRLVKKGLLRKRNRRTIEGRIESVSPIRVEIL